MSDCLVVFAGASVADLVDWRRVCDDGRVREGGAGELAALSEQGNARIILVLPGEQVTSLDVQIAARSERQLLAAAPFSIEDQLASDLEDVHVALNSADRRSPVSARVAYVTDRTQLGEWIETLKGQGLRPEAVLPDFLALPADGGTIVAAQLPGRMIVRDGDWGAGIDVALGHPIGEAVISARAAGRETRLLDGAGEDLLDMLAVNAARQSGGLLQGAFAVRGSAASPGFDRRRWGLAGVLVALAAISVTALNLTEAVRLKSATTELREQTETVFRAAFPEAERMVNPRAQIRAMGVSQPGDAPGFLVYSAWLAGAVEAVPDVEIDSVRFDGQRDQLSANVIFSAYEQIERLRAHIEAAGGVVEEGGSQQQGERRAGEIIVRRP